MEGLIAVTYRCNARCHMCNTWQHQSEPAEEVTPGDLESLPRMKFANITGGEPFLRDDIEDIIAVIKRKADRTVVSSNGYFTDRVLEVAKKFPDIGFRASIEGLPAANDELRGLDNGFDHGLRMLLQLRAAGVKDIGFSTTMSDRNIDDVLELYELAEATGWEFATSCTHNSYYFHKFDNVITQKDHAAETLHELARRLLKSRRPKNWFRAWFNMGLANRVKGGGRALPCRAATDVFFVDPFGVVRPCNVMEESLGSLKERPFGKIWSSPEAEAARAKVASCDAGCWMIGTVAPAMKRDIIIPAKWVLKAKLTGTLPPVEESSCRS